MILIAGRGSQFPVSASQLSASLIRPPVFGGITDRLVNLWRTTGTKLHVFVSKAQRPGSPMSEPHTYLELKLKLRLPLTHFGGQAAMGVLS